jgi:hypothetical protein
MDAVDIERRVREEWEAARPAFEAHGIVPNLVAPPYLKKFRNSFFQLGASEPFRRIEFLSLWVVADDGSGGEGGFLIVFDEERLQYGLATSGVFLNYDRSLVDTIMGI